MYPLSRLNLPDFRPFFFRKFLIYYQKIKLIIKELTKNDSKDRRFKNV